MAKNTGKQVETMTNNEGGLEIGLSEFPAYWEPSEGATFTAYPVMVDKRDPDFERILFKATHPLDCFRGPKDDQEEVTVEAGEQFSVSLYKVFQGAIEEYIMLGLLADIPLTVTAIEKATQKADKKKTYWKFSIKVPADYVSKYNERMVSYTQAKRLAEKNQTVEG